MTQDLWANKAVKSGTIMGSAAMLSTLLFCMLLTSSVTAQFGDGKKEAPPKAPYRKADLKYIGCQVCEAIVKQSLASVRTARQEATPGKKVSNTVSIEVFMVALMDVT